MALSLDHLVVATRDLDVGLAWMAPRLGPPSGGGAHPGMGTHNALWRLGAAYLELIAIDPGARAPRPRWFGLDDPVTQARLVDRPRLLTWVLAAEDLEVARRASLVDPGPAITQSRGTLSWRITVPEDGRLTFAGAYPSFIRWPEGTSPPPARLPDQGLMLERLDCLDAPEDLASALVAIGAERLIAIRTGAGPARLVARIATPGGQVTLD